MMSCSWMDRVRATLELRVVINYGGESAPTSRDKFSGSRRRFKLSSLLFTQSLTKREREKKKHPRATEKEIVKHADQKMRLLR